MADSDIITVTSKPTTRFTPVASMVAERHIVCTFFGSTATRRTSTAVGTAPEPIFYFYQRSENHREGLELHKNRHIKTMAFGGMRPLTNNVFETIEWAVGEIKEFQEAFSESCFVLSQKNNIGGTVVWDLGKDVRDLLVLSHFGDYTPDKLIKAMTDRAKKGEGSKPNPFRGAQWGPVEAVWASWIQQAKARQKFHQIFIEKSGPMYRNNQIIEGQEVLKCGKSIDYASRAIVHFRTNDVTETNSIDPSKVDKRTVYSGEIVKPDKWRMLKQIENLSFPQIASKVLDLPEDDFIK